MRFKANCLTTGIGSLPLLDAASACNMVLEYFDVPYWPQLPKRSARESMPQFFEGFPGLVTRENKLYIDPEKFESELESFYQHIIDYETSDMLEGFAISKRFAPGLYQFLEFKDRLKHCSAIKGQIIGPISFGLNVTGRGEKPMIYNDDMHDALISNLAMKVRYQEEMLRSVTPTTIIFVDESSLDLIYSPHVGYDEKKARQDLEAILRAVKGLRGIHCCTNTNWPFLLDLVDVISFDAYTYADKFIRYHEEISGFIDRGGIIAWGIVPASNDIFHEDASGLMKRLESNLEYLATRGVDFNSLLRNCLITPVCGLGTMNKKVTIRAYELTKEVSCRLRRKYSL